MSMLIKENKSNFFEVLVVSFIKFLLVNSLHLNVLLSQIKL